MISYQQRNMPPSVSDSGFGSARYRVLQSTLRKLRPFNFRRSVTYGFGVLATTMKFTLQKLGLVRFRLFNTAGRTLPMNYYRMGKANRG